jgi:hypothetical protein
MGRDPIATYAAELMFRSLKIITQGKGILAGRNFRVVGKERCGVSTQTGNFIPNGFGGTQDQNPARFELAEDVFKNPLAGRFIEVDEYISAKDQIERPEVLVGVAEIATHEIHIPPNLRNHLSASVEGSKVLPTQNRIFHAAHEFVVGVDTCFGNFQNDRGNISGK